MPKKSARPSKATCCSSDFLKVLLALLVLSLALLAYTVIKVSGLKSTLSYQKNNLEDSVKDQLAPAKIAELNLKIQKAQVTLNGLAKEVNKSDAEEVLKTASELRLDVEDIWRDTVALKDVQSVRTLGQDLTKILSSESTYLNSFQSKARGSDASKLKLEASLVTSLLSTISTAIK